MNELSTHHLLVVDDDDQVRRLLVTVLQREGFEVASAVDAQQALEMLDQDPFDLMLLDLHMPGPADGEDLLYLLRDRGDSVPIIVVSGWVDDEVVIDSPDCVQAVVKKPINIQELVNIVRDNLPAD
ncbi:MAG: response regulator [Candidatus Latescibacteria bacterium]|nr:response regulator [Candidatus Latescibacterota bacterium]